MYIFRLLKRRLTQNTICFTALCLICVSFISSCGKDDDGNVPVVDIDNIEGTYIGVFTDQQNHEKAFEGNVTITKVSGNLYTLELICDGHNIHAKAEAVEKYISFGETNLKNGFGDNQAIWWHVNGSFQSDGLFLICSPFNNGNTTNMLYYFRQGKKRN